MSYENSRWYFLLFSIRSLNCYHFSYSINLNWKFFKLKRRFKSYRKKCQKPEKNLPLDISFNGYAFFSNRDCQLHKQMFKNSKLLPSSQTKKSERIKKFEVLKSFHSINGRKQLANNRNLQLTLHVKKLLAILAPIHQSGNIERTHFCRRRSLKLNTHQDSDTTTRAQAIIDSLSFEIHISVWSSRWICISISNTHSTKGHTVYMHTLAHTVTEKYKNAEQIVIETMMMLLFAFVVWLCDQN